MPTAPLAFDLCCGAGGWTDGLLAAGFRVVGFDLCRSPRYSGTLVICDVLTMTTEQCKRADVLIASTPCEEFAVHGMRHFHPAPPPPVGGLRIFDHVREIFTGSGKPWIMENVRSAQQFAGPAVSHFGSFYLWGSAVPALFPAGKWTKGLTQMRRDGRYPGAHVDELMYMDKKIRKAVAARIPFPCARHVAASLQTILQVLK